MPGRHANTSDYRYGFQGQEMDDEIKGEGNSVNYKYRMHDPRVGRFFAIDPLSSKYPHYTPYSFSGNKVIQFIELEGLEETKFQRRIAEQVAPKLGMTTDEFLKNSQPDIHMMLDGLGFVPVIGEGADLINGAIYTYKGDYLNAGFSTISLVPVVGDAAGKGLKYSLKAAGYSGKSFRSLKQAKIWIGNALEYGFKSADAIYDKSKLAKAINITQKGMQAHHVIPVEAITKSEVVQKAIDAGFDFNGMTNGIAIKALSEGGQHANHPAYTKNVLSQIDEWLTSNPNYTGEQAKNYLNELSGDLKDLIQKESIEKGTKINNLDF